MSVGFDEPAPTRRFTVAEYERMVEIGVLQEDEPIELLFGRLCIMSPQGPFHGYVVDLIAKKLFVAFEETTWVREEKPLAVGEDSMPEPDVSVVRGNRDDFRDRHPRADEALMVVEVAVSSQAIDHEKAVAYAANGVPVYWLVDVEARRIEVFTGPLTDGRYGLVRILAEDDEIEVPVIGAKWRVGDLFP